jgi:hypothetical protein
MDGWYEIVRKLEDESSNRYRTQQTAQDIFRQLSRSRIKDKGKFKNRMGPEFEPWAAGMVERHGEELITELLNDDQFWNATLALTIGV